MYDEAFIKGIGTILGVLLVAGRLLKPIFDLLKVDMQSKFVSGIIAISTIAPRFGQYVLSRDLGIERIKQSYDYDVRDEMVGFRRNLRKKFVMNVGVGEDLPRKGELLADIKQTHSKIRRRHAIGEVLIGVVVGILAIIVGRSSFLRGIGLLLTLYLLVFPLSMALRNIVVDTLAYPAERVDVETEEVQPLPRPATLVFMQGWNRMLLRNEAIMHKIIFVTFAKGEFPLGYERGEQIIEEVLANEKELDEALDDLVQNELGEDTTKARWIRQVIKRYIGV